jgi:dihydrofolate reductase
MSKLIVSEFVTLDGAIEDPGGAEGSPYGGWAFKFEQGEEGMKFKLDETMGAGSLLLGRKTYEGFAAAWPSMGGDGGFGDKMNGMPKHVVTSSPLGHPVWNNSTAVSGELEDIVARAKQDGDVLVGGSGQLVQGLLARGLVDELRLMVFPTVLGGGKRIFGEGTTVGALKLTDSRPAGDTLILVYEPAG